MRKTYISIGLLTTFYLLSKIGPSVVGVFIDPVLPSPPLNSIDAISDAASRGSCLSRNGFIQFYPRIKNPPPWWPVWVCEGSSLTSNVKPFCSDRRDPEFINPLWVPKGKERACQIKDKYTGIK